MLENCTIVDIQNYNNGVNNFKSRKAAKLSTYKVFYPKTKDVMSKLRNNETQVEMPNNISVDANQIETSHETREIPSPKTEVSQSETPAVTRESVDNFLPKEVYEQRLASKNVVCFNSLKGNNNLVGNKRLRVKPPVNETCVYVTNTNGVDNIVYLETKPLENTQQEPQDTMKQRVDFSQLLSSIPTDEVKEREFVEPKYTPNIDDYWKKENVQLPSAEDVTVNEITELARENENLKESIETQKEILASLLQKQESLKIQRAARRQELSEQKLALTQELNDLLAEINQISDIVNEEEATLGISDNDYRKVA